MLVEHFRRYGSASQHVLDRCIAAVNQLYVVDGVVTVDGMNFLQDILSSLVRYIWIQGVSL